MWTQQTLLAEFIANIRSGHWKNGVLLPPRRELARKYSVGLSLLQRVVDELVQAGFLAAKTGQGTFVTHRPPSRYRFGVVLPYAEDGMLMWSPFQQAFVDLQEQMPYPEALCGRDVDLYYALNYQNPANALDRLKDDVRQGRLAGLIFPQGPGHANCAAVLSDPYVKKLIFAPKPWGERTIPAALRFDFDALTAQGLRWLREKGCRRIALLAAEHGYGATPQVLEQIADQAAKAGVDVPEHWRLVCGAEPGLGVQSMLHLLMSDQNETRPDGIFLLEGGILPAVLDALLDCTNGEGAPPWLVSHESFTAPPAPTAYGSRLQRIGFDLREAVVRSIGQLEQQTLGIPHESTVILPARPEGEIPPALTVVDVDGVLTVSSGATPRIPSSEEVAWTSA